MLRASISVLLCSLSLSIFGCASFYITPPDIPLSNEAVSEIISELGEQEKKVFSFYSTGNLSAGRGIWSDDSDFLIVGLKEPLKIKIEITHPWGRPILNILIDGSRLKVLSFQDRIMYVGTFTAANLSRFFPIDFEAKLVWGILRGYPSLPIYDRVRSLGSNQVTLFDNKGIKIQEIVFSRKSLLPEMVYFREKEVELEFSDYQENIDIMFAKEVSVDWKDGKGRLIFQNDKIVFNQTIPKEIFDMKKPHNFRAVFLDDLPMSSHPEFNGAEREGN